MKSCIVMNDRFQQEIVNTVFSVVEIVNQNLSCSFIVDEIIFPKTYVSIKVGLLHGSFIYRNEISCLCSSIAESLESYCLFCRFVSFDFNENLINLVIDL